MSKLKLNLGCGDRKLYGFINIDIRNELNPDVCMDVTEVSTKWMNEVDLIYACHVLEHFPFKTNEKSKKTYKNVLVDWYKSLKIDGILRLAVPNLKKACEYFIEFGKIDPIRSMFWGGQKYEYDIHYYGWSFDTLKKDLEEIGFKDICQYDWRKTEHFYVDDYSQSYLPHMDKENGELMSLNVEAIK